MRERPWMMVVAGVAVSVIGQSWDIRWHAANPGVAGYGPAQMLFYVGIAVVMTGAAWWAAGSAARRRGRRER